MSPFDSPYYEKPFAEGAFEHSGDTGGDDHTHESAHIHESSYIDRPCRIGAHTEIMRFSHVMAHSIIGSNCLIGNNVTVASGVYIANNVQVMNNTTLNSGVILEDEVYCGPSTVFTENKWLRSNRHTELPQSRISPTLVRFGAKIGANTTIGSGLTIGRFSFVEAGSVIDSHVPDFAIVYGNPLKFAGWQCRCGQTLLFPPEAQNNALKTAAQSVDNLQPVGNLQIECGACGRSYAQTGKFQVVPVFEETIAPSILTPSASHTNVYGGS
ncbi:MAG: acyltransferase [Vampirovibrionales bacterium]|nr:acyltransferase [Vampirovibrionales bacterium]